MWKRTTLIGAGALVVLAISTGCSSLQRARASGGTYLVVECGRRPDQTACRGPQRRGRDVRPAHDSASPQAMEMSDMLLGKQGIDPRVSAAGESDQGRPGPRDSADAGLVDRMGHSRDAADVRPRRHAGHERHDVRAGHDGAEGRAGRRGRKLFLTQMIAHHEGAITMAQNEIKDGQYPPAVEHGARDRDDPAAGDRHDERHPGDALTLAGRTDE